MNRRCRSALALTSALLAFGNVAAGTKQVTSEGSTCESNWQGEVVLKGGKFLMGARPQHAEEGPPIEVRVDAFAIDRTEVTNEQFGRFVAATGYVTTAERELDASLHPQLEPEQRRPESLVFVSSVSAGTIGWQVIAGADWRHPHGPGSSIVGAQRDPAVHVSYDDALAYATWAGRDLPTEAEWEFAARAGEENKLYEWGDAPDDSGQPRANHWEGSFPGNDAGHDGYRARVAPVACFAPNRFGLYDMSGNVWEWTRDWYRPGLTGKADGPASNDAFDPIDGARKHVIKGGSFLCADSFCARYRPAARQGGTPDSGSSHIGFRTVKRLPQDRH